MSGMEPWCDEVLNIKLRFGVISHATSFRNMPDIWSGPIALSGCIPFKSLSMPVGFMLLSGAGRYGLSPLDGMLEESSRVKRGDNWSLRMFAFVTL